MQASVDRSQQSKQKGETLSWEAFEVAVEENGTFSFWDFFKTKIRDIGIIGRKVDN